MDQQDQSPSLFEMEVDSGSQAHLLAISKWSRFIAIVGFCGIALFLIILLANADTMMESFSQLFALAGSGEAMTIIIIFLVMLTFFTVWCFFLFRSSRLIRKGLYSKSPADLAEGFKAMKTFFILSMIYSLVQIVFKLITLV